MSESSFPKPVADVVRTLIDIFRHQSKPEIVELLENTHSHFDKIDYDNLNGGTYTWALRCEVPVHIFASVEPRLSEIEEEVKKKLDYLERRYPNHYIGEVTVTPLTPAKAPLEQQMDPSDIDQLRIWREAKLRLFLSHVSKHKVQVSALKDALKDRGISAFVAHEDIEPSREWQDEIELALRSMHVLVAIITPDFHESDWTDQEVGWALGQGILVLPVRLSADPYGFVGKVHAITGTLEKPVQLRDEITSALLRHPQTQGRMRRSLVSAFAASNCFATATQLKNIIVEIKDFTDEEKESLRRACIDNDQVYAARGVKDAIYDAFGKPPKIENRIPDYEIPF